MLVPLVFVPELGVVSVSVKIEKKHKTINLVWVSSLYHRTLVVWIASLPRGVRKVKNLLHHHCCAMATLLLLTAGENKTDCLLVHNGSSVPRSTGTATVFSFWEGWVGVGAGRRDAGGTWCGDVKQAFQLRPSWHRKWSEGRNKDVPAAADRNVIVGFDLFLCSLFRHKKGWVE